MWKQPQNVTFALHMSWRLVISSDRLFSGTAAARYGLSHVTESRLWLMHLHSPKKQPGKFHFCRISGLAVIPKFTLACRKPRLPPKATISVASWMAKIAKSSDCVIMSRFINNGSGTTDSWERKQITVGGKRIGSEGNESAADSYEPTRSLTIAQGHYYHNWRSRDHMLHVISGNVRIHVQHGTKSGIIVIQKFQRPPVAII